MRPPPLPRTVILDYYDSYTNNILTLFTKLYSDDEVLKKVVVIKADKYTWADFQEQILPHVDCIILSPGPGRPDNPSDIGFALDLLRAHPVPILGVCLGHQAIGVAFGASIVNTPKITHGHVVPIRPIPETGLFSCEAWKEAAGDAEAEDVFEVVVYNSLTVDPDSIPKELEITAWSAPTDAQPTVQGLAHRDYPIWGVQYHPEVQPWPAGAQRADDQSISSTRGAALLQSFLSRVHAPSPYSFSSATSKPSKGIPPTSYPPLPEHIISSCAYRVSAGSSRRKMPLISPTPLPTPPLTPVASFANLSSLRNGINGNGNTTVNGSSGSGPEAVKAYTEGQGQGAKLVLVEKRFGATARDVKTENVFQRYFFGGGGRGNAGGVGDVWLDGRTPTRPTNSSLSNPSFLLTYSLSSRLITLHRPSPARSISLQLEDESFWDLFSALQSALAARLDKPGRSTHGWRGGWAGWMGYEMKEESLAGYRRRPRKEQGTQGEVEDVDAAWGWCDRVLERTRDGEWVARGVVAGPSEAADGVRILGSDPTQGAEAGSASALLDWLTSQGVSFGVSRADFDTWVDSLNLSAQDSMQGGLIQSAESFPPFRPIATGTDYTRRIEQCREAIRQGESYELTLTTSFTSTLPSPPQSTSSSSSSSPTSAAQQALSLYLRQRTHNPAYYSTFISFPHLPTARGPGITVLSSSPERFLRIDEGVVEMMPIKGTRARVKPGQCVCSEGRGCGGLEPGGEVCRKEGEEEDRRRGEALRLDPKERAENLMIVDLIRSDLLSCCTPSSVVVPKLIALESYGVHNLVTTVRGQVAQNVGTVEAVRRCFPPGSMTGAPKLRSVQMLEGFEGQPKRGIYSGALGYISLDGTTDLSVVIRTMVLQGNELSLGAGGAITWLSNPEGEWDEVLTKVKSVVGKVEGV